MPISSPSPLSIADYEAIESAVMETARGRWFLAEFAKRNRHADTDMLLTAMGRLENAVRGESLASVERLRSGLVDMAEAIARAKADIAALKPEGGPGRIEEATEELDAVVGATAAATSDILGAAEQIQEVAWTLREQGLESSHCDKLDGLATDIYTACSFQDITGQRTRKVIQVMRYLENRIGAMIDLWGPAKSGDGTAEPTGDQALLNGPAKPGQGLGQSDVDLMMHGTSAEGADVNAQSDIDGIMNAPAGMTIDLDAADDYRDELPAAASTPGTKLLPGMAAPASSLQPDFAIHEADEDRAREEAACSSTSRLVALSADEKIALFT